MQHPLIYILAFALGGLQLTPVQQRFHCHMTGQRDLVRCCCEARDAEAHVARGTSAVVCGHAEQTKAGTSHQPCERESPDDDPGVEVSVCCDVTHVATPPPMVNTSRKSRDVETAACGQPIVIPAVPYGGLHGVQSPSAMVALNRNGPPGGTPPRFILHCSFLI